MKHFKILTIALLVTATAGYASGGSAHSSPGVEKAAIKLDANTGAVFVLQAQPVLAESVFTISNQAYVFKNINHTAALPDKPFSTVASNGPDISKSLLRPSAFSLKEPIAALEYISSVYYARINYLLNQLRICNTVKHKPDRQNC